MTDTIWFLVSLATMVVGYLLGLWNGRANGFDEGYTRGCLDSTMAKLHEAYRVVGRDDE